MKKNYFRKSIAILMALVLVIWLPCGAMGDGTVATPTFDPAGGDFITETQSVTISCDTPGATIYYTINGENPTTESSVYNETFSIAGTTTIKAIAVKNGTDISEVASVAFTKKYTVTVDGTSVGNYAEGDEVTITASNPAEGTRFAGWTGLTDVVFKDGSSLTTLQTTFIMPAKPLAVTANYENIPKFTLTVTYGSGGGDYAEGTPVEITANPPADDEQFAGWSGLSDVAFAENCSASISPTTIIMPANALSVTATYKAKDKVATPTFTPAGGEFTEAQSVTINGADGATIYYTTNGSDPTTSSESYSGAISVQETTTIKAIAVKENMLNSDVAQATYTISTSTASDPVKYEVTVVDGEGDGSYAADTSVTITAKAPESGKVFDKWTTNDGVTFADESASTTTFTMPGKPVTVTANFKAAESQGTTGETGGGSTGGDQGGSQGGSQGGNQGGSQGGNQGGSQGGSQGGGQGGSQGSSGSSGNTGSQGGGNQGSGSGNTQQNNPPASGGGDSGNTQNSNPPASNGGGSTAPAGAQTSGQPSNTKVAANTGDSGGTTNTTNTASSEPARDPNKTYAPDGSEYNPDTGSTDKTGLVAVSGGAKGASFNILDPVKTTEDKTMQNLKVSTTNGTRTTTTSASSGPAGATSTTSTDNKTTTDGTETDPKTEGTDGTEADANDRTYSIAGGYNVMLIGLAESNIQSETWPLLMQRGIVFEDFERGEDAPEDTGALLQDGIEGVKQDGADDYWNSPSAAATAGDLINQFGFYGILEQEKQTDDAQMLAETARKLASEGLVMNERNIPFFMDVQFTGNGGQGDTLRQLITELENDGLGGNTVLIFTQTGKDVNGPLVIVHPMLWENKTVTAPMKAADLLATILSLSGQAGTGQMEMLATLAGTNLLTTEELAGVTGLVPEPKAEEEAAADDGVKAEAAGSGEDTSGIAEKLKQSGFGMEGMPEMNLPQGMKTDAGTKKVTTNSTGAGPGSSDAVVDNSAGPGSGGDGGDTSNSAGPGGSGEADDSYSAGPGGTGTGEVSSDGPGAGAADDSRSAGPGGIGTGEVSSDGPGHP